MSGPAASPQIGRFHRKVALALAGLVAVSVLVLLAVVYLVGIRVVTEGARQRAEAMARSALAALPPAAGEADAMPLVERLRLAVPEARSITLRDAHGEIRARVTRPGAMEARISWADELPVGRAVLPESGRLAPGGSLELVLDRSPQLALLRTTLLVTLLLGAGLVAVAAWLGGSLARRLSQPVRGLLLDARRMASGDLRVQLAVRGSDEVAELSSQFNLLAEGLRRMIADLRVAAEQVSAATAAIGSTSQAQMKSVVSQTASLEVTASTVAEIAVASRLATESAQLVIEVAARSEKLWQEGSGAVRQGMVGLGTLDQRVGVIAAAVTELSDRTVQIAGIIATMKDLAEQSNVLALNAAIEAAKVGDAGMGFAVVAEEMRRLAEQSRRATDEVRTMLVELQRATRKVVGATSDGSEQARAAVQGAEKAGSTIEALATAIEESSRTARGIADTTRRQTEEMEGIAAAVEHLHANMGETVLGARRIDEVAQELARVSVRLAQAVSAYQI
jgi:methyl-accepting chemotaxis protein